MCDHGDDDYNIKLSAAQVKLVSISSGSRLILLQQLRPHLTSSRNCRLSAGRHGTGSVVSLAVASSSVQRSNMQMCPTNQQCTADRD